MTRRQENPAGAPTMREVASDAGVSAMTVSRVLKDDRRVTEATRTRVLESVARLGYRRNEMASSLRRGSSGLLGLVVTNIANPFYSRLAVGVQEVADEHGLRVLLASTGEDVQREQVLVDDLMARQVTGLVVVPAGTGTATLTPVIQRRVPLVLAARPVSGLDVDCVLVDDFGGAREATSRLLAAGHERIGFLGNPPALYTGAERFRGYWDAHEHAGLHPSERLVRRGLRDPADAERAAGKLLTGSGAPTALFCTNNRLTQGAVRAVQRAGVAVSVAGFDDFETADLLNTSLTLAAYDADELGRRAARMLLERIEAGPAEPVVARRTVVPTHLVEYGPR